MAHRKVIGPFGPSEGGVMIGRYEVAQRATADIAAHSGLHPYLLELLLYEFVEAVEASAVGAFDRACLAAAPRYRSYWDQSLRLLEKDSPGSVDRLVQIGAGVRLGIDGRDTDFLVDMSLIIRGSDGYELAAGALRPHLQDVWRTDTFTGTWLALERSIRDHLREAIAAPLEEAVDSGTISLDADHLAEIQRWMARDQRRYGTQSDEFDYLTTRELLAILREATPSIVKRMGRQRWDTVLDVLVPARNSAMHGRQLTERQVREAMELCDELTTTIASL